jgi:ketosteroid isomerase-like protein
MMEDISDRQQESVLSFFAGANNANAADQLQALDENAEYWSIDGEFNRFTYRGKPAIERFLNTFFDTGSTVSYEVRLIVRGEDLIAAEWSDAASTLHGSDYENQGVMIFRFVPGTARIIELRSYFDWKPLLAHTSWREGMSKL